MSRNTTLAPLLLTAALLIGTGCSTMNTARPLEPGQHAVGATVGGPLLNLNGPIFPLPLANVEGRSGLTHLAGRPLDVNYGLHLTSLLFGDAGVHAGASYLLLQQQGLVPALSVASRLYFFTNVFDQRKPTTQQRFWALDQLEATISYELWDQLIYAGLVEYLDLELPSLFLAPFLGVEVTPGLDWLGLQLEGRYLVPWISSEPASPQWVAPANQGGVLVTASVILRFDLVLDRAEDVS